MKKSVGVVLGGGVTCDGKPNAYTVERLKIAQQLFQENKIDCLILTGKGRHPDYSEAHAMHEWLDSQNIDMPQVYLETQSLNTFENALYTHHHYLQNMDIDKVYIITNAFHMDRAMVIFNGVSNSQYEVVAVPARDIDQSDIRAWKEQKGTAFYKKFFENIRSSQEEISFTSAFSMANALKKQQYII